MTIQRQAPPPVVGAFPFGVLSGILVYPLSDMDASMGLIEDNMARMLQSVG